MVHNSLPQPPEYLYFAATPAALPALMIEGIRDRDGEPVRLYANPQAARTHAPRGGRPVMLRVHAQHLVVSGFDVEAASDEGAWLVDYVPIQFFDV